MRLVSKHFAFLMSRVIFKRVVITADRVKTRPMRLRSLLDSKGSHISEFEVDRGDLRYWHKLTSLVPIFGMLEAAGRTLIVLPKQETRARALIDVTKTLVWLVMEGLASNNLTLAEWQDRFVADGARHWAGPVLECFPTVVSPVAKLTVSFGESHPDPNAVLNQFERAFTKLEVVHRLIASAPTVTWAHVVELNLRVRSCRDLLPFLGRQAALARVCLTLDFELAVDDNLRNLLSRKVRRKFKFTGQQRAKMRLEPTLSK